MIIDVSGRCRFRAGSVCQGVSLSADRVRWRSLWLPVTEPLPVAMWSLQPYVENLSSPVWDEERGQFVHWPLGLGRLPA